MKFICDVHIAYQLVRYIKDCSHEVLHVNDILQKSNTIDSAISEFADINDFILITDVTQKKKLSRKGAKNAMQNAVKKIIYDFYFAYINFSSFILNCN